MKKMILFEKSILNLFLHENKKKARLHYCKKHQCRRNNKWGKIVFGGKSQICLLYMIVELVELIICLKNSMKIAS